MNSYSADNRFQSNFMYNNNGQGGQAFDSGQNNIFANNYWNDWGGSGDYVINGIGNMDSKSRLNPVSGVFLPTIFIMTSPNPIVKFIEFAMLLLGTLQVSLLLGGGSGIIIGISVKFVQNKQKKTINKQLINKNRKQIVKPHIETIQSLEELLTDLEKDNL